MSSSLLPQNWQQLVSTSRAVRGNAFAPFSGYSVGAAVQTGDGRIFAGCNVENSSYGLSVCAERSAACAAVAAGSTDLVTMVVSLTGTPVPCGMCRQFLYEFNPQMVILLDDLGKPADGPPECVRLADLLPRAFRLEL